jgi:hypothetical protein
MLPGRNFSQDREAAEPAGLISCARWQPNFVGDPECSRKNGIILDGAPTRMIGVFPANFETSDLGQNVKSRHAIAGYFKALGI